MDERTTEFVQTILNRASDILQHNLNITVEIQQMLDEIRALQEDIREFSTGIDS